MARVCLVCFGGNAIRIYRMTSATPSIRSGQGTSGNLILVDESLRNLAFFGTLVLPSKVASIVTKY
jgi:hypothetical protein